MGKKKKPTTTELPITVQQPPKQKKKGTFAVLCSRRVLWFLISFLSMVIAFEAFRVTDFYRSYFPFPDHDNLLDQVTEGGIPTIIMFAYTFTMFLMFCMGEKKRWVLGFWLKSLLQIAAWGVTFFVGQQVKSLEAMVAFYSLGVHITCVTQVVSGADDYGTMDSAIGAALGVATQQKNKVWGWVIFVISIPLILLRNYYTKPPPAKKKKITTTPTATPSTSPTRSTTRSTNTEIS